MILSNGVIRTMDPSLPTAAALAIAGDKVAGGVGVHETALASPETIDLGGLTVVPGFTDSHVHFAQWSLAQRQVRLEGTTSLDEAVARVAAAAKDAPADRWLRGIGWRSGMWEPQVEPTPPGARRGHRRHPRGAHGEGRTLALAELGGFVARATATCWCPEG